MEEKSKYNPKDGRAAKIAEKLKKGAAARAKNKGKKIDDMDGILHKKIKRINKKLKIQLKRK